MPQLVEAGAHHLRLAAQAVRILHARAVLVRRADRAAIEQRPVGRGGLRLAAMAAHRMDARVERRVAAETASTDSAPATNAAASARSAANRPASASAVDTCVPLSSARPSFGPRLTGCRPARASASRAGMTRPSTSPRLRRSGRPKDARAARGRRKPRPIPSTGCTARRRHWRARPALRSRSSGCRNSRAQATPT